MTAAVPAAVEALRARLLAELPWSPFDYVDGISREGERALHVEALLHPLDPANELRFVHGERDRALVLAEVLPWDSAFFGQGVARLSGALALDRPLGDPGADLAPAIGALLDRARAAGVRYLFAQVDPRDLALQRALGDQRFALIETRVHHHRALGDFVPEERHAIRLATPGDLEGLERTAREMSNPYDRFHSDPAIDPAAADRLMERWVRASVTGGFADATWVPDHPHPLAFCTTKWHEERWERWGVRLCQPVVLGAVRPEFKGWYRRMISEICVRARERGAGHAFFVTQVANPAAVRSVERLGFRLGRGELVFRRVLA